MKQLPDKLSDLIEVALKDLEAVEKDPNYKVEMDTWHRGRYLSEDIEFNEPQCAVCLAGAVIAKSLGFSPNDSLNPNDFNDSVKDKLCALDLIRRGNVRGAITALGLSTSECDLAVFLSYVPDYSAEPDEFKEALRLIAVRLKECGL